VIGLQKQPLWAQADAGQAGNFLRYGVGGRALGMGRAFVAVSDDASGVYWNPAGLLGIKRIELASMYSDLYYDSRYTHFGIVIPRPGKNIRDKVGRYLVGDGSALGFGWIGLTSSGYEQRTQTGEYLGDFDIGEHAFLLSWAREEVGSWGILRYGLSFKFVNQNFSGLQPFSSSEALWQNRDWSGGIDIGFLFQPFNAPLFRVIPLRYLLPFRLGLAVQNVVQPSWRIGEDERDHFPRLIRYGMSYRWILRDWMPRGWESARRFVGRAHILTTVDGEYYDGASHGIYFGVEGYIPFYKNRFVMYPRFGLNNRSEGPSLGFGLSMPLSHSIGVRVDYVYGFHPDLPEDNRFFLTVQMGREMDAAYFREASRRENLSESEIRKHLYRVIADYPNDDVSDVAEVLATLEDSSSARRLHSLTGGVGRAIWLFQEAKSLLANGNIDKARRKAREAAGEFQPVFRQGERLFQDEELMDYGESLVIAGRMREAIEVLRRVEDRNLRTYFLLGTCLKALEDWDGAIEAFRLAVRRYEEEQDLHSMVHLSFLGLGAALVKKEQYESALTTLEVMLKDRSHRLNSNYPRYPIFWDEYAVDDAQFLVALTQLLMKQYEEGVASLVKTQRLYPGLSYGRYVQERADEFVEALENSDWERIDRLTRSLLDEFFQEYNQPLQ